MGDGRQVLAPEIDVAAQAERVRAGDGGECALPPPHPRHGAPIVEPNHQIGVHLDVAT